MNILIVGNGFDLSHYLPTKYDHFMDVMRTIEEKDLGKPISDLFTTSVDDLPQLILKVLQIKTATSELTYQMNFKDLFSKSRDKKFIEKTQEIYDTKKIVIPLEKILEIQYKLKNNSWYQYFSDHVREVKTWIDFETKINEALNVVAKFIVNSNQKLDAFGSFSHEICFYANGEERQIFLTREQCNSLEKLNILESGYFIDQDDYDERGEAINIPIDIGDANHGSLRFYIDDEYIQNYSGYVKVNSEKLLNSLQEKLDEFIVIFNLYLELIVSQLSPINSFTIDKEDWTYPEKIFSFNYTNTFQRIHDSVDVEYLHGSHGQYQNIVLGISDIEDEGLKKIKAFGFTKYHQKLFKDTDYLFLDHFKEKVQLHKKKIEYFEKDFGNSDRTAKKFERQHLMEVESKLNLKIQVWGHSLDVSDKDHIIDLFSLNDDVDRNVRVTIFYFDKPAKFSLLNNLLAILGKDKVEQWMKNKWLEFKPNPEVNFEIDSNLEEAS